MSENPSFFVIEMSCDVLSFKMVFNSLSIVLLLLWTRILSIEMAPVNEITQDVYIIRINE